MISVKEADDILRQVHFQPPVKKVGLTDALGMVLAAPVQSDRDLPPFNRSTMDGIAIRSDSFARGLREYKVKGVQSAGVPPFTLEEPGGCVEIMTGAVVPADADTVVRYEDVTIRDGIASIKIIDVVAGQNIHRQGKDAAKGSVLLPAGQRLSAAEVAVLASVGLTSIDVYQPPKIAVVSTGDELVAVDATPKPWQLRTSNGYAIVAALSGMGISASMFHLSDDEKTISENIARIIPQHDVIVLSGGVSKGKFDYVPGALEKNGIAKQFHDISQRPGKPMWFGRGNNKTVFALPGNPVSTFMCFHRYVKPWLERSMHQSPAASSAILKSDFQFNPPLTYFLQVKVKNEGGRLSAEPDPGGGSGDFANLRNVDGFLELPLEKNDFKTGEAYTYFPFRT